MSLVDDLARCIISTGLNIAESQTQKTEVTIAERKREGVIESEEWYGIEESTRRTRSWRKGINVDSIVIYKKDGMFIE